MSLVPQSSSVLPWTILMVASIDGRPLDSLGKVPITIIGRSDGNYSMLRARVTSCLVLLQLCHSSNYAVVSDDGQVPSVCERIY